MSRVDLRFLSSAFALTLDRRRQLMQFTGLAAGLLVVELTSRIARAAQGPEFLGALLAFPFFYVILMAAAVVVCASCRHSLARQEAEGPEAFEPAEALARLGLPAATGAAVLCLAAGGLALAVSLVLAAGKLHASLQAAVSLLAAPLAAVLGLAVAMLVLGLLVFPPLAAAAGGDLDGLLSQLWRILSRSFFRLLCQLGVSLALAAFVTGLLLAALWAGGFLLQALAATLFGPGFREALGQGVTGFLHRLEWLLILSAAASPALVFLNASACLILSAPAPEAQAAAFDEEEETETWLLP